MATDDLDYVTSVANDNVKIARSMGARRMRRDTGLFLTEGREMIEHAQAQEFVCHHLFVDEAIVGENWVRPLAVWAKARKGRASRVTNDLMATMSPMRNPPQIMALLKQQHADLPPAANLTAPDTWLVLEDIRDPGNLGTIIRTADAAGAKGIILVGLCTDPYSPEAVRASTGSIFAVPVAPTTTDDFAQWAKAWPGLILGSAASGAVDYRETTDRHPVLLLIGSESNGLSARLSGLCHTLARIPMSGTAESLNAATATALLLYEVRRRYLTE